MVLPPTSSAANGALGIRWVLCPDDAASTAPRWIEKQQGREALGITPAMENYTIPPQTAPVICFAEFRKLLDK